MILRTSAIFWVVVTLQVHLTVGYFDQYPILRQSIKVQEEPLSHLQQPGSTSPRDYPYRKLPWGDVNIIHTTDTHGWLLGHQRREASYSGDWGDLYSFVNAMKKQARERGVDLLMVDSGDRVDGNGLVDAEPPGHVKGWTAMKFFDAMPYDVVTTGNHELYKYPVALSTYQQVAGHFSYRYLTSNVNITLPDTRESVPLGQRYRKFETEMGKKVTALGPLFYFKASAEGVTVQKPSEMIQEEWFRKAIEDCPDFFLLVGHMSVRKESDSEWTLIFDSIRSVHPKVPILIFGGHHHIRDCVQEDKRSMSLASGRYMETVGWMSVSGLGQNDDGEDKPLRFARRYLDQNRNTYKFHGGDDFDTKEGMQISTSLKKVADSFNLTLEFGTAPQSYFLSRYPATSTGSIFRLMTEKVLPLLINRPDRPFQHVTILNTGSIRFDIFKGSFTRNDQWIILPFTNNFEYISNVPRSVAIRLLEYLNKVGEHGVTSLNASQVKSHSQQRKEDDLEVEQQYQKSLHESYTAYEGDLNATNMTWGYVTKDLCEQDSEIGPGDDTMHKPLPHTWQPVFVSTVFPPPLIKSKVNLLQNTGKPEQDSRGEDVEEEQHEERLDVVFFDFIQVDILSALNVLQDKRSFTTDDVGLYIDRLSANTLMQEYASKEWTK